MYGDSDEVMVIEKRQEVISVKSYWRWHVGGFKEQASNVKVLMVIFNGNIKGIDNEGY